MSRALPPPARVAAPASLAPDIAPADLGASSAPLVVGYGRERDQIVERAMAQAREAGQSVLCLVPEIETARRWAERLQSALREPIVLYTSGDPPRRRWQTWWSLRQGPAGVAVGTRVAAFLPAHALGLVVVVDEHDPGHKAPDAPRWHARTLALRRAAAEGAACVMISGAPSLESWVRVLDGQACGEETKTGDWPEVHQVDLRPLDPVTALAPALCTAVRETLAAGRSAVLILNRLGYGQALGCLECGSVRRCSDCRLTLTYHRRTRLLACRLCGVRRPATSLCGRCRGRKLAPVGWGTERLEVEAIRAFPGVAVARLDGEVSATRQAQIRAAFRAGRVRVIVGTQMALRLLWDAPIGVAALVDADALLSRPDFRAGERTFQLAWQLAENVAPGGSLWLQSRFPGHPALDAVARGAREVFYSAEWAERRALGYPPARRMALIVARGRDAGPAVLALAERCRTEGLVALGPAELPGGRTQLVLLGDEALPRVLSGLLEREGGSRRRREKLVVDVDPMTLG